MVALVTANDPEATGDALRTLRSTKHSFPDLLLGDNRWRLFHTSAGSLRRRATWRLTSPRIEQALSHLVDVGRAVPIGDIFHVRQGVRTGSNPVFMLTTSQVEELPKERAEVVSTGHCEPVDQERTDRGTSPSFLSLQPEGTCHHERGGTRQVAARLFRALPPIRNGVGWRSGPAWLARAGQTGWGLSRHRSWALEPRPHLVSKYFGGPGSFATDLEARYIVVQGFAWFPRWTASLEGFLIQDVLAAYMAVMNSTPFARLLEIFSPQVAGGQFDLSARYVKPIPVPDLPALSLDERTGQLITDLAKLGNKPRFSDPDWRVTADRLTTELFGGDIFSQV